MATHEQLAPGEGCPVSVQTSRFLQLKTIDIIDKPKETWNQKEPFGAFLSLDFEFHMPILLMGDVSLRLTFNSRDRNEIDVRRFAFGLSQRHPSIAMPDLSPVFNPTNDKGLPCDIGDLPQTSEGKHQVVRTIKIKIRDDIFLRKHKLRNISAFRIAVLLSNCPSSADIRAEFDDHIPRFYKAQTTHDWIELVLKVDRVAERWRPLAPTQHNAHPPKEDRCGELLCWAAGIGDVEFFETCLKILGDGQNSKGSFGMTPLAWAALMGRDNIVDKIVQNQGKKLPDKEGGTPLSWAARNGHDSTVLLLLQHEYNLEEEDKCGKTPLAWADKNGHAIVVQTILKHLLEHHSDTSIDDRLSAAAANEQKTAISCLIDIRIEKASDHKEWLSVKLYEAIKNDWTCVIPILLEKGAPINTKTGGKPPSRATTINENIDTTEDRSEQDINVMLFAVKEGKHEAVKILLRAGVAVDITRDSDGKTPLDVAIENDDVTMAALLSDSLSGKLAHTVDDLDENVDQGFSATVVDFFANGTSNFKEVPVNELMKKDKGDAVLKNAKASFKWFHLPANNMKWVEVLISRLYDEIAAYKVLRPDRWVDQQHRGRSTAQHSRYMLPFCTATGECHSDRNMVVFMPYLHWEDEKSRLNRNAVFKSGATPDKKWTNDQKLLYTYIHGSKHSKNHLLHVRRTLDQFYYNTLDDTSDRDKDQVVSRFQQRNPQTGPSVVELVDQLWLWVITGPSGKAETVISCFPSRDLSDFSLSTPHGGKLGTGSPKLDPNGKTDVLQTIREYINEKSEDALTAYDLAGIIVSRCSKVFLHPSNAEESLRFSEVYKSSIGRIMDEEIDLFETFKKLIDARDKRLRGKGKDSTVERILSTLGDLKNSDSNPQPESNPEKDILQQCKYYYKCALDGEIPSDKEMKELEKNPEPEKLREVLEKLAHFHVLDITKEIGLLREIKDIQYELNIMAMVFEDQQSVVSSMERKIRSMKKDRFPLDRTCSGSISPTASVSDEGHLESDKDLQHQNKSFQMEPDSLSNGGEWPPQNMQEARSESKEIWGEARDKDEHSLPLRIVRVGAEEVQKMTRRAEKVNEALNFLVDLKQKQSRVIDARTARIQAEQSRIIAEESGKHGTTLMIFTVVTIVFLPMSFIAAFYAIPLKEFSDNEKLNAGEVSRVMFPLSAAISTVFILVAFKAKTMGQDFRSLRNMNGPPWGNVLGRKKTERDHEDPVSQAENGLVRADNGLVQANGKSHHRNTKVSERP